MRPREQQRQARELAVDVLAGYVAARCGPCRWIGRVSQDWPPSVLEYWQLTRNVDSAADPAAAYR